MQRVSVIAIVLLTVSSGCGSGEHFRLEATRSCLHHRGYKTSIQNNWIFKPSEGSLAVEFGRRYVALNFGKDDSEARRIRAAALHVDAHWPIAARANVAYVWSVGARGRVGAVVDCLRS